MQAVGGQARLDAEASGLARFAMRQADLGAVEGAQGQPGQPRQFRRPLGHGRALQQRGRTHDDARHFAQLHGDHRRIRHGADPDRAIDVLGDQIGHAVVQQPFHPHVRIALQVSGQRLDELVLAEHVRRHHAQHAGGLVARAAHVAFEGLPGGEQLLAPLVAALPVFGQADGVGGALQQPHPHRAFQQLQPAADGRLRAPHLGGRGGQAAGLDDAHERFDQQHAVGAGRGGQGGCGHTPIV
ncbi:hypothetical protein D3C72_1429490 [compost metagenome]